MLLCAVATSYAIDSKGAIIIANIIGKVEVVNNTTQVPLAPEKVKAGGILFDGHTVKASKGSKAVLLMSSGTILTVRENSSVNLKKFAQEPFKPGDKKLSELKNELSPSETIVEVEKVIWFLTSKSSIKNPILISNHLLVLQEFVELPDPQAQTTFLTGGCYSNDSSRRWSCCSTWCWADDCAQSPGGGFNTQPASAEEMNSINADNAEAESSTADVSMDDAASAQSEVEEEAAAEEEAPAEEAEEEPAEKSPLKRKPKKRTCRGRIRR